MSDGIIIGTLVLILSGVTHGQRAAIVSPSKHVNGGNSEPSPLDVVRVFYSYITRHQPLGIPKGNDKKALWPLMSKQLVQQLNTLQLCEDDYYTRYGELLRKNDWKPSIGWLEYGLFSGGNEAATPSKFSILSAAKRKSKVDVHLRFTYKQTYCCGAPPAYEHYEGIVEVISEDNRFVIDDYVALGDYKPGRRLSEGFSECQGGKWVGRPERQSRRD